MENITARQAFEIAIKRNEDDSYEEAKRFQELIQKISNQITNAANEGLFYTYIGIPTREEKKKKVIDYFSGHLGFKIVEDPDCLPYETSGGINFVDVCFSWKNKED